MVLFFLVCINISSLGYRLVYATKSVQVLSLASFLTSCWKISIVVPSLDKFPGVEDQKIPGEIIFGSGNIVINPGRKAINLKVTNEGDRPIQVIMFAICLSF